MSEIRERFTRQAAWQSSLKKKSWAEKVRMAEKARHSVGMIRAGESASDRERPEGSEPRFARKATEESNLDQRSQRVQPKK